MSLKLQLVRNCAWQLCGRQAYLRHRSLSNGFLDWYLTAILELELVVKKEYQINTSLHSVKNQPTLTTLVHTLGVDKLRPLPSRARLPARQVITWTAARLGRARHRAAHKATTTDPGGYHVAPTWLSLHARNMGEIPVNSKNFGQAGVKRGRSDTGISEAATAILLEVLSV